MAGNKRKYSEKTATAVAAQVKIEINDAIKYIKILDTEFASIQKIKTNDALVNIHKHFKLLTKILDYLEHTVEDWSPYYLSSSFINVYQKYQHLLEMADANDINVDIDLNIQSNQKIINSVPKTLLATFTKRLEEKLDKGEAQLIPSLAFLKSPKPEIIYRALDNPKHANDFATLAAVVTDSTKLLPIEREAREAFEYALSKNDKLEGKVLKNSDIAETLIETKKIPIFRTARQAIDTFEPGFWRGLGRRLSGTNLRASFKSAKDLVDSLTLAMQSPDTKAELEEVNKEEQSVIKLLKIFAQKQGFFSRILGAISGRPNYREMLLKDKEELTRLLAEVYKLHDEVVNELLADVEILDAVRNSSIFQKLDPKNLSLHSFKTAVNNILDKSSETNAKHTLTKLSSTVQDSRSSRDQKTGEFIFSGSKKSEIVTAGIPQIANEFPHRQLTQTELEHENKRLLQLGYTQAELTLSLDNYDRSLYEDYYYSLEDLAFAKRWGLKECEDTLTYAKWKAFKAAYSPLGPSFDMDSWQKFVEIENKNHEHISDDITAYIKWKYFVELTYNKVSEGCFHIIPQQITALFSIKKIAKDPWSERNLLKLFVSAAKEYPTIYFANAEKYRQIFESAQEHLLKLQPYATKTIFLNDYNTAIAAVENLESANAVRLALATDTQKFELAAQ